MVLAAVASLGVLAVVAIVASSTPMRTELMDKQQAAWWGAPHKDGNGNWDQGWLARYVNRNRGREHSQQLASAPQAGSKAELDQIHGLLDEAVGMLGAMEGGKCTKRKFLAGVGALNSPNILRIHKNYPCADYVLDSSCAHCSSAM